MTRTVTRLEGLLFKLEDYLFHLRVCLYNEPAVFKHLPKSSALREALLTGDHEKMIAVADQLFDAEEAAADDHKVSIHFVWHYFCNIVDWLRYSQRVYAPSTALVNLLQHTDLPDFPPDEIKFMANSFAVHLPESVTLPGKVRRHDFLLLTKEEDSRELIVTSFPACYGRYVPFTNAEKDRYSRTTLRARLNAAKRMQKHLEHGNGPENEIFSYTLNPEPGDTYKGLIDRMPEEDQPELEFLYKVMIGLNLYLQSNRKRDTEERILVPAERHARGNAITNNTQLFRLETSRIVPARPSDGDGGSGIQMPYHFRNAHWRRPKGSGHDPDAVRSEWVTWTWVREDRKGEGAHPGTLRPVELVE